MSLAGYEGPHNPIDNDQLQLHTSIGSFIARQLLGKTSLTFCNKIHKIQLNHHLILSCTHTKLFHLMPHKKGKAWR
jgi:hypothetical protein